MTTASTLSLSQASFSLSSDPPRLGTDSLQLNVVGTSPSLSISEKTGSTIENLGIGSLGSVNSSILFRSAVDGLIANLGDGSDTLIFNSTSGVVNSTISMDGATGFNDTFVSNGGFVSSTVSTGGGNDSLGFSGYVSESSISAGAGNDTITFGSRSLVEDTNVNTGGGNDNLTFLGQVYGGGPNSQVSLGAGADTLVFGASSYVEGYSIDLGSDSNTDKLFFNAGLDVFQDIEITGASTGDTLFIGSGSFSGNYLFDGTNFANGSDTLTWLS